LNLLVASAGGHLSEIRTLIGREESHEGAVWATYDSPDVMGDFGDEVVIPCHHPTTKNLSNAVRNFRVAKRVLSEYDFNRVISTGAGIAVPFLFRAWQLRIPCFYIESAARVDGPSLTGRILALLPGIHLLRQMGDWGEPRWKQGPCVFDGYRSVRAGVPTVHRIVVSLGTHQFPYPALVTALQGCLLETKAEVFWQLGSTSDQLVRMGTVVNRLSTAEFESLVAKADVVVGHAGVGLAMAALDAGKVPVLVPRRRSRREHTDDHQAQLARELSRRGLAVMTEVDGLTAQHLAHAASLYVSHKKPPPFRFGN
jgi:UDP-N-acetylglucosamine--N-acetylmuramyl-(pentapeptide) pyrophosphoryl-undecaprenol N-acetylglucosamine transferase